MAMAPGGITSDTSRDVLRSKKDEQDRLNDLVKNDTEAIGMDTDVEKNDTTPPPTPEPTFSDDAVEASEEGLKEMENATLEGLSDYAETRGKNKAKDKYNK